MATPDTTPPRSGTRDCAWLAVLLALSLGLLFLRKADSFLHPQLVAEDAVVFYEHADTQGWHSLFQPNAGYYHTVPRIVALTALQFSARYAPFIYHGAAGLFTLAIVAQLYWLLRRALPTVAPAWIVAIALAPCWAPHTGEVFISLTNAQWWGGLGLALWLLRPAEPTSLALAVAQAAWLALLCLTGPFAWILAPLFLLKLVLVRRIQAAIDAVIVGAGGWLAWRAFAATPGIIDNTGPSQPFTTAGNIVLRLARDLTGADSAPGNTTVHLVWALGGLGLAVALIGGCARHADYRRLAYVTLGASALLIGSVIVKFAHDPGITAIIALGDRYYFIPKALAVLLVIAAWPYAWRHRGLAALAAGVTALLLFGAAQHFRGETWPDKHWSDYSDRLDRKLPTSVPINPGDWVYRYRGGNDPPAKP